MGATFSNLQVRTDERAALAARIAAALAREGLSPAAEGEAADREVALVGGGGWVSVFDPAHAADEGALARDALAYSAFGEVIAVQVYDSDSLQLRLYRGGRAGLVYDSDPRASGQRARKAPAGGHARAWAEALGVDEAALEAVFRGEDTFAESALGPLAAALEVAMERLCGDDAGPGEADGASLRLRFRRAERPAWERRVVGPPALVSHAAEARAHAARMATPSAPSPASSPGPPPTALGAPLRLSLGLRNRGGPARGLRVTLTAPRAVTPRAMQLVVGNPAEGGLHTLVPVRAGEGWVVEAPDVTVSAGVPPLQPSDYAGMGPKQVMALGQAGQVYVNVDLDAAEAGEGVVQVRVETIEPPGAAAEEGLAFAIRDTAGRPLRAAATVSPMLLDALRQQDVLTALVIADVPAARLAQVVAGLTLPHAKARATVYGPKPKLTTGGAAGFFTSKRWAELVAQLAGPVGMVQVDSVSGPEDHTSRTYVALGSGVLRMPGMATGLAVALSDGADLDAAERTLRAAIDTIAQEPGFHQAFLTRWGAGAHLTGTPYELASGVCGQCTMAPPWVSRWVRGLGVGALWLGPALRAAAGLPGGAGPRIDVVDPAETERQLAAVLPDAAAWQAGVREMYAGLAAGGGWRG